MLARGHRTRHRSRTVTTTGAALVLTVAALAGCSRGGSDQAAPSVTTTTTTTPSTQATTATTTTAAPTTSEIPLITAADESVTSVPEPEETVASDLTLSLPSLGIDAPVIESGVTQDLVLQVPSDPSVLGRWSDGARPGDGTGSVVLAGHVSYRGELGVLHTLQKLEPGDEAVLTTTGGEQVRYVADQVDVYKKSGLPYQQIFQFDIPERLVLITCGGKFDRSTGHYDSNVVAYLKRA